MLSKVRTANGQFLTGGVSEQGKTVPVDWKSLIAELLEEIPFGLVEGGAFVGSGGEVFVEPFHQGNCEDVICGPKFRPHNMESLE
jgi:hypothetical protein